MEIEQILRLVRDNVRALTPYSTARDEYKGKIGIFLDANESPYPGTFNRYPDPHQKVLKEKVSAIKGQPVEKIFLGNGSDEAIDLMYRIFCTPGRDNAIMIAPSYGMYSVCAEINDIEVREVPLGEEWSLPAEELLAAADANSKLLFICSPNNPTGNAFPKEEILSIVERFPGIVVVDEAYVDFSPKGSLLRELPQHKNLVVLQTMSKARGLAGLRLGMAFADPLIIDIMSRVKYPYNISQATLTEALTALESNIDAQVEEMLRQRDWLLERLPSFSSILKVYPSDANFILVKTDNPSKMYTYLLSEGIIVRNRDKVRNCGGCLRISIGIPQENMKLIKSLEKYEEGDIH